MGSETSGNTEWLRARLQWLNLSAVCKSANVPRNRAVDALAGKCALSDVDFAALKAVIEQIAK